MSTQTAPELSTFQVRLKPTPAQKLVLNLMIKVTNHAYNWCIHLVETKGFKPKQYDLEKVVGKTNSKDVDPDLRMPDDDWFFDNKLSRIKTRAVRQYASDYQIGLKKVKKREYASKMRVEEGKSALEITPGKNLPTEFKTELENEVNGYIAFQKECVNPMSELQIKRYKPKKPEMCLMIFNTSMKGPVLLSRPVSRLPPLDHDMKIIKRPDKKFILCIPCKQSYTRKDFSATEKTFAAIDPGIRTFATVYEPENNNFIEFGNESWFKSSKIQKIQKQIDETNALLTKVRQRGRGAAIIENYERRLKKLHFKIKKKVDGLHGKINGHIRKNYSQVAWGDMAPKQILMKDGLTHGTKRKMQMLSHGRQHEKLARIEGVTMQNEKYTSMTCSRCGYVNKKLGSASRYVCPNCEQDIGRDENASINIWRKYTGTFFRTIGGEHVYEDDVKK
ncbi:putative methyltransferase [Abalone herpesvirus Victoria/AUS/2009]|uniref:Putative methyltransferase n=1 Tax=Abalone herpesvirus (isolate Abalone/Australia/Victoria/2009) TaxID=1241371 RepID=K4JYK0_ABHV|nr:putative methyltransferase [Abalone herpesvirus Victoria/AUS/2009]AFU90098.1 putative methyltransferase [Abalone herpesvirus Victoria/AUS/2009]